MASQEQRYQKQMQALMFLTKQSTEKIESVKATGTLPNFVASDSSEELRADCWARFESLLAG